MYLSDVTYKFYVTLYKNRSYRKGVYYKMNHLFLINPMKEKIVNKSTFHDIKDYLLKKYLNLDRIIF